MHSKVSRDVWLAVLNELSLTSLRNVSLTCHFLHDLCSPLIFSSLHLRWKEIEEVAAAAKNHEPIDGRVLYAKHLVIAGDSRGEWAASPGLSVIDDLCQSSIESMEIECALKSSGWLKYIKKPLYGVESLRLTTRLPFQNQTFDFSHITETIPNLRSIVLGGANGGFTIDPQCEDGLHRLQHIEVRNCEWQYPSKLSDAAANSSLESLTIILSTHMHPFAFSERLRTEFSNLPATLQELKVVVKVGKRLNWNPLQRSKPLLNLGKAVLEGFDYVYHPETCAGSVAKFPRLHTLEEI